MTNPFIFSSPSSQDSFTPPKNNAGRMCSKCSKRASFGMCTDRKPSRCATHKKNDMISFDSRRCVSCKKRPSYAEPNERIPTHCIEHKADHMVALDSRRCQNEQCSKRPTYGFAKSPTHCFIHRQPEMIALDTRKCHVPGCTHRARYGCQDDMARGKPVACLLHRAPDMLNCTKQGCNFPGCLKFPCYGKEGQSAKYCSEHKQEGMMNVKVKPCGTPNCPSVAHRPIYRGHCSRCFSFLFPEAVSTKKYRSKELSVVDFLRRHVNVPMAQAPSYNQAVQGGCSKYRPDILYESLTHSVIVEIDEHQHDQYDDMCESKRLVSIWQDLAFRPLIVIRFNPDAYIDPRGVRVPSCFSYDKVRGSYVSTRKEKEWNERLSSLNRTIASAISCIPEKSITEIRLFYDEQPEMAVF